MAVPFRRTSKTTKRMRRTHFKLSVSGLVTCPNCGAMIVSHRVCPNCGYYDGKEVVSTNNKKVESEKKLEKKTSKKAEGKKEAKKVTKKAKKAAEKEEK